MGVLQSEPETDRIFIQKASKLLNQGKWEGFLLKWAKALESYGTPRTFVDSTTYRKVQIDFQSKPYYFVYTVSKNYAQRSALMAQQQPYLSQKREEDYKLRLDLANCFLCQNVVQGLDAKAYPEKVENNIMYDLGTHVIIPNRYPGQLGHSLSLPKDHDELFTRVTPQPEPENKTTIYHPEKGKTRGAILSSDYLAAVIKACDKFHLAAIRNHVLDGMSIPGHDHFHLMPEDLPSVSLGDIVAGEKVSTEYGPTIFRPGNSPFDTLMVLGDAESIALTATPILSTMELNDQVFTLAYHQGKLFISPRNKDSVNDRRIQVGGGIPIHYLDTEGPEFINRINRLVPMKGDYGWEHFLP